MVNALEARWRRLLNGLWFVPSLMIAGFAVAAIAFTELDKWTGLDAGVLFSGDASAARTVLSTIAGSLITVAGLVFSLTVVVLQLASSQFSPRVLPNFLGDRLTQATVGAFVGIFVFCLIALRSVGGPSDFVPRLTVTATSVLSVGAVVLLIVFIHHVSQLIQVSHTLRRLAAVTARQLDSLYPGPFGTGEQADGDSVTADWRRTRDGAVLAGAGPGYVAGILLDDVARAIADDARIHLRVRPGDFVTERTPLGEVYPSAALGEDRRRALLAAIVVAGERDVVQDVHFGIRQLADVALRAISPSVNDPTTAMTCLGYIRATLERLAEREFPSTVRAFREKDAVVVAEHRPFAEYLQPLVEIGRYAGSDPRVLAGTLDTCLATVEAALAAGASDRAAAAVDAAREIAAHGLEAATTDGDRRTVQERLDRVLRAA
jgi:uncharacterized membrane protein